MKRFIYYSLVITAVSLLFVGCKLKSETFVSQEVDLNLTSWDLPNEGTKSVPFSVDVESKTENGCYGKIAFEVEVFNGNEYVFAQTVYTNSGEECADIITTKDSTISITKSQAGKYYYYFLKDYKWNKDSIIINP